MRSRAFEDWFPVMEKRKDFVTTLVPLVLVCWCSFPAVWGQAPLGSINIDCGAVVGYLDSVTTIQWVTDANYISTGQIYQSLPPSDTSFLAYTELKSLRAFNDTRTKNCYTLPVMKNMTYLLRASFNYGNYDKTAKPPTFQLSIEASIVESITTSATGVVFTELVYLSQSNVTYLCLLRDESAGVPFISAISLKPVSDGYEQMNTYLEELRYLTTRTRINFGASAMLRYPSDPFDRYWYPEGPATYNALTSYLRPTKTPLQALSTTSDFSTRTFRPPPAVMQTAVTTTGNLTSYMLRADSPTYEKSFLLLHFAELDATVNVSSRAFYIDVGNGRRHIHLDVFNASTPPQAFLRSTWLYWDQNIGPATLLNLYPDALAVKGPIINALELFSVSAVQRPASTLDRDVHAIESIKSAANLTEWTGDPCLPFPHPWVVCIVEVTPLKPPEVAEINLSGYNLKGPISPSFAELTGLTRLSLANNALTGPLPDLRSLVNLKSLELQNNNLSDALPSWLTNLTFLKKLSVENNNFSGLIPPGLLSSNTLDFTAFPGNPFLEGGCQGNKPKPNPKSNLGVIIGASVGGFVALVLIGVGIFFGCRRYRSNRNELHNNRPSGQSIPREIGLTDGSAKPFTMAALTGATNNFKKEIGRGGFGPVYHGTLPDGREVAVKVADGSTRQGQEFSNEVALLSRAHHRNLVALLGFCQDKNSQILVYEYVRNGSLYDQLHGNPNSGQSLDWRMRLNIALNAAQGLDYLHSSCSPSIIHRDVKSGNILLTGQADVAKVADFGLSRAGPILDASHVSTLVRGTAGYLDPQYFDTQKLNLKSDVYSFGVVLLELITGRIPIDPSNSNREECNLCHWVRSCLETGSNMDRILDPAVRASNPSVEGLWRVAEAALRSVEPKAVHRPTMAEVIQEIRAAIAMENIPRESSHGRGRPMSMSSEYSSNVFYESDNMPAPR